MKDRKSSRGSETGHWGGIAPERGEKKKYSAGTTLFRPRIHFLELGEALEMA
jgi:hypothetical protein